MKCAACAVVAALMFTTAGRAAGQETARFTDVIPRPRLEKVGAGQCVLAGKGAAVVLSADAEARAAASLKTGTDLLRRRLAALGGGALNFGDEKPALTAAMLSAEGFAKRLARLNVQAKPDARQLRQAYVLEAGADGVQLGAGGGVGLYYGLVSLCQLAGRDKTGRVVVPEVSIADWPAVGLRLAKTSASLNPPKKVGAFAAWLAPMKLNVLGLQYHGSNSKRPGKDFTTNVRTLCRTCRDGGVLETIVYFCPFRDRSRAYDFSKPNHRKAYTDFLRWIMDQGAHGVEVDYNDWPGGRKIPIADTLNLVCETLQAKHPDAYVLYCPPVRGPQSYRGMATDQMRQTLSKVPAKVWPLWTGMQTLIGRQLKAEQIEKWTRIAGRRPFLWVNRVSLGARSHFARKVSKDASDFVFRGDALPRDLGRLVEGVHLNAGISKGYNRLSGEFAPESIAYLATAADYLWNPRGWTPAESARRAKRFVEVMKPLLQPTALPRKSAGEPRS